MTTREDLRTEQAVSAGGVVYRQGEHGIDVLLCGRAGEGLWALPKGTPEPGESLAETALREVSEETGVGARIVGDLGTIEYEFARPAQGVRYEKTVHHYLMEPTGAGDTEMHDSEYDSVAWFPAEEAARVLTHRNEVVVLRRALRTIEEADGR